MSSGCRITGRRASNSGPRSSAGRALLPTITGCTNSTETCWASVAAEPLPKARSLPPARKRRDISRQASASRGASVLKKVSKMLFRRSSSSLLRTASVSVSNGRIVRTSGKVVAALPRSLGSQPRNQRRRTCRAAQLDGSFEAPSNIAVELRAMIPIVRERRVDLSMRQVRVLEVQLFETPSIRLLFDNQLQDLLRRAGDARNLILVQHKCS